jgi:hypothetical protein
MIDKGVKKRKNKFSAMDWNQHERRKWSKYIRTEISKEINKELLEKLIKSKLRLQSFKEPQFIFPKYDQH